MAIVIVEKLSREDVKKAREEYSEYIKVTIDIFKRIVAIGGEYHADAEEILVRDFQCHSKDIWGGGYNIKLRKFEINAVLNIKPKVNDSAEIIDPEIRDIFFKIAKEKLAYIGTFLFQD